MMQVDEMRRLSADDRISASSPCRSPFPKGPPEASRGDRRRLGTPFPYFGNPGLELGYQDIEGLRQLARGVKPASRLARRSVSTI
jgi:hypothetical protein